MPAPPRNPDTRPADAWGRLWATGVDDTFGGRDWPLRAHWQALFERLAAPCHLLDIGTGNAPLPRLLLQTWPGDAHLRCTAVDAAACAPAWLAALPPQERGRITLRDRCPIETLALPPASVDYLVSQHGLEYCADPLGVLARLRPALRPGAHLALALHHPNSRPVALAREEREHISWLHASGWVDAATAMTGPLARLAQPGGAATLAHDAAAQATRRRFDAAQAALAERAATSAAPDVLHDAQRWWQGAFAQAARAGASAGVAAAQAAHQALADTDARLADMLAHTISDEHLGAWLAALDALGLRARAVPAQAKGHLMATWLTGEA